MNNEMLKKDRGTVLYIRVFKNGDNVPQVINVIDEKIGGIICESDSLEKVFKGGAVSGLEKNREKGDIALIKSSGVVIEPALYLGKFDDIERIELTIVYPDGTTKLGTRYSTQGIGTLIWDDNLIRHLQEMNSEYFWTGNNHTNPAVLVIQRGIVVDRFCSPSSMNGCNSQ